VTEAGSDYLPPWLTWDQDSQSLLGVPDFRRDMFPPEYHILVTAHFPSAAVPVAQQVFTIHVKQEASSVHAIAEKKKSFVNFMGESNTLTSEQVNQICYATSWY